MSISHTAHRIALTLGLLFGSQLCASAQAPAAPSLNPAVTTQLQQPKPQASDSELLKRLEEAETANQEQSEQIKQLNEKILKLTEPTQDLLTSPIDAAIPAGTGGSPVPDYTEGSLPPNDPAPGYPDSNVVSPYKFPLKATFGPGFQVQTDDGRYRLQIHYESQIEGRIWNQGDQLPANSGLYLPRQRIFFNGNIAKNVEYELAINRGVNNINVLNAYLNFHYSDRMEFRIGRFFTPFSYDQ